MVKVIYDFREGMEREAMVYKKKPNVTHGFYYFFYLLLTWGWTVAWFSLFQYAYLNHESIAFWVYIAFWLAFAISIIVVGAINIVKYKDRKKKLKVIVNNNDNILGSLSPMSRENNNLKGNNINVYQINNEMIAQNKQFNEMDHFIK